MGYRPAILTALFLLSYFLAAVMIVSLVDSRNEKYKLLYFGRMSYRQATYMVDKIQEVWNGSIVFMRHPRRKDTEYYSIWWSYNDGSDNYPSGSHPGHLYNTTWGVLLDMDEETRREDERKREKYLKAEEPLILRCNRPEYKRNEKIKI